MTVVPLERVEDRLEEPTVPNVQLNLAVRGLGQSSTLAINERSARLEAEGRTIYRMGLGQSPFPVPDSVVEALKQNAHQKDYLPVRGLQTLRETVAYYHGRVNGLERCAEDVLVGPGSKELMFILQLAFYGDLIVPSPSWVSYTPQANIAGRQFHWVETQREDGWRLTPEALEEVCAEDPNRPRILILNYPSNPLGVTYDVGQLRALAKVARRFGLVVVSDEIYGELHYEGAHESFARFYPEGTIVSAGLSKWCGAGGWRLGTFTFPPELRWVLDTMAVVASESFTSTSAPIQFAAVRAFERGPEIETYLRHSRAVIKALGPTLTARLRQAGCDLPDPEGGFYLLPSLEPMRPALRAAGIRNGRELTERILEETGVAVLPGSDFGRPKGEFSLRLAYVNFDGDAALKAAAELAPNGNQAGESFAREHCAPTVEGIERLSQWIEALTDRGVR